MTIHSEHPFADPPEERDPVRRLRGRLGGAVTLMTTASASQKSGLTVSSVMVATGDPGHVLALVDPDSDLASGLVDARCGVVQLLSWQHRDLAEAFAGSAPAPGGPFRMASWTDSEWGPVLDGASAWAGFTLAADPVEVGWSLLVDGILDSVTLGEPGNPLVHRRGRYLRPDDGS